MPSPKRNKKEIIDWEYSESLTQVMVEFEKTVEEFREAASKASRNLVACRRARTILQKIRTDVGANVRQALFNERDKLEALRHSMTLEVWKTSRSSKQQGSGE